MRCLPRTTNLQRGAGRGRAPPRRGVALRRLARLVPRSGGVPQPPPAAPCGLTPARGFCGRRPVGAKRRPFSRAGRPPSAGARLVRWPPAPLCCPAACCCPLAPVSPPSAARPWFRRSVPSSRGGSPPSGAGRRSAPGMGALGRPPPLRCAVHVLAPRPVRGFSRPHPGGLWFPAPCFRPPAPSSARQVGPGGQKYRKWCKNGRKIAKTGKNSCKNCTPTI